MSESNRRSTNRCEGAILVPEVTAERLNASQITDYREHRRRLIEWMATRGKSTNGRKIDGYAETTVNRRAKNLDMIYRWVWDRRDGYTTNITHEDGHDYIENLVHRDLSGTHKSNLQKTLRMYYRWREFEFGEQPWESKIVFSSEQHDNPQDYLTRSERRRIREASLEYDSIPHYCAISPEEREQWNIHLAKRFGKSTAEIGREDFERANGNKFASLVCVSLETGLRPIEVERAKTSWVDLENDVLRIPVEDSAKNRDSWAMSLSEQTSAILESWLEERAIYEKYEDTELIWLTRHRNPYQSTSLKRLLQKLCDEAGIDYENRQMTWYSIRHSLGTYLSQAEDLAATKAQLRHRSVKTTMKYNQAPLEDRRDALRRME